MKTYAFQPSQLPLEERYDVIVVGGGPAGCTAATAAAREGAKTLLIEATSCLGGMGTSALVPAWCPFSDKQQIIYRGLAQTIFERSKAGMPHVGKDEVDWVPIDPEQLKCIYDDLVLGAGADILFGSSLAAVDAKDGTVAAIIVANKAGMTAYRARVYIDATGDGDLAAWAGAVFDQGNPTTGDLMPATHCFTLANVDEYALKYDTFGWWDSSEGSARRRMLEKYPGLTDGHLCKAHVGPGVYAFNAGHLWDVDGTRPETVSKAVVQGRKIAREFRTALADFHPAFKNAHLVNTGSLLGIRETRRIVGDYVLTLQDYLARQSFPDEICRNSYPIDIHATKTEIGQAQRGEMHAMERYEQFKPGESHGIPYRCLTPRGLRNVLVAGRAISCDQPVQGSVRVMPVCLCMGEAAGVAAGLAASLALGAGADVHAVDTAVLRERLRGYGAYLP